MSTGEPAPGGPAEPAGTSNEVSRTTVQGAVIQARSIGELHVHQPATAPPPVPGQLSRPRPLVDRDAERRAMTAARDSGVMVVTGPPGIGKTALAVSWAHEARRGFPDGVLLADLRGHAPGAPAAAGEVLGQFLRALGADTRQAPAGVPELTGLYRTVTAGRRLLVVLDDAVTAGQVLPLLPSSPDSAVVITSRRRLGALAAGGARVIHLGPLGAGASVDLLGRIIGDGRVLADPQAARRLAGLCAGLPLAAISSGGPPGSSPTPCGRSSSYLGRHSERLEFDRLGLDAARQGNDMLGEAKMLYRLGTAVIDAGQLDDAENFIGQAGALWQQLGRPDKEAGCHRRLGYVAMARGRHDEAADWFALAVAAYREVGDNRHVAGALSNLGDALTLAGRLPEAMRALYEALALLAGTDDPHSRATALIRLGRAHARTQPGNPEALKFLTAGLSIARQAGDVRAEAAALTALGDLARDAGQEEEARVLYGQAQQVIASPNPPQPAQGGES